MRGLWTCGARAAMCSRGLDRPVRAGAKSHPRSTVHLQEVAMKTVITSASIAMLSRFSKALGH
jgi:hypothetical protein